MGGDQGQLTSPTPPVPSEARQRGQHRWAITGSVLAHSQPALGAAGGVFTEGGGGHRAGFAPYARTDAIWIHTNQRLMSCETPRQRRVIASRADPWGGSGGVAKAPPFFILLDNMTDIRSL